MNLSRTAIKLARHTAPLYTAEDIQSILNCLRTLRYTQDQAVAMVIAAWQLDQPKQSTEALANVVPEAQRARYQADATARLRRKFLHTPHHANKYQNNS